MFTKNRMAPISGFVDLALLPLRSAALICAAALRRGQPEARVTLLRGANGDGEVVYHGHPDAAPRRAEAAIAQGERIVVDGITLEAISELCRRHNYRWRLHPDRRPVPRFVLEPAVAPAEGPAPRG